MKFKFWNAQQPCQNNGKCVQQVDDPSAAEGRSFHCECPTHIYGRFCQIRAPHGCLSGTNPCQNGGTCAQAGNFQIGPFTYQIGQMDGSIGTAPFKCLCAAGWTGPFCEQQFCSNGRNPCQNGALCLLDSNMASGHRCICPLGWEGQFCEVNVENCRWAPCMNGGTCRDEHNAFRCHCAPGFRGELCQHRWLLPIVNGKMQQQLSEAEMSDRKKNSSCSECANANGLWPTLASLLLPLMVIIALLKALLMPLIQQHLKKCILLLIK